MNCPECNEPIAGMATRCHHCGAAIDEKTFCLNEDEALAEMKAARVARQAESARLSRGIKTGQVTSLVGVLIGLAAIVLPGSLKLVDLVAAAVVTGIGIGLWWSKAKA